MSLYERVAALPGGMRSLAAARLRRAMLNALHKALRESVLESQAELAKRLKVRRSAVNQVFRGDGNLRVNTLAEYLYELGYELEVTLVPAGEPRAAVRENRLPAVTLPATTWFTSALYTQGIPQTLSITISNVSAWPWSVANVSIESAENPFHVGAIWGIGSRSAAFSAFEPIDLSNQLIRPEIAS
jgi:transcriptional regulator with XRE-family HTH domain